MAILASARELPGASIDDLLDGYFVFRTEANRLADLGRETAARSTDRIADEVAAEIKRRLADASARNQWLGDAS